MDGTTLRAWAPSLGASVPTQDPRCYANDPSLRKNPKLRQPHEMVGSLKFLGAFLRNRKQVGAVLPSSPLLAKAMVRALGDIEPGKLIIELGPGTGAFTKRIVDAYPNNPIMMVEFTESFVPPLQARFPQTTVVNGCASELSKHISDHGYTVDQVGGLISGLPLLSMPQQLRDGVWNSIAEILPANSLYIQFTYSKRAWRKFQIPHMDLEPTKRVLLNVPPAVVLPFRRRAG